MTRHLLGCTDVQLSYQRISPLGARHAVLLCDFTEMRSHALHSLGRHEASPFKLRAYFWHAFVSKVIETAGDQSDGEAENDHHEPSGFAGWEAALSDHIGDAKDK
jgi:hypothetical protein